jgi:hypothetical protein
MFEVKFRPLKSSSSSISMTIVLSPNSLGIAIYSLPLSGAFLFFGNNFSFSSSDELISITSRLCELSSFSSSSSALSLFSENPFVFSSYVYNVVFDVFWISQSALIKKDVS